LIRSLTLTFLAVLTGAAGISFSSAQTPLAVERVYDPASGAQARARGEGLSGRPLRPDEAAAHRAKAERWHGTRDFLTHPDVNWSVRASRRTGWRAPTWPGRDAASPADAFGLDPDTLRVAILRIDFLADRDGSLSSGNGRFDLSPADPNAVPIDRPPRHRTYYARHLDALGRYWDAQSYGRLVVTGDVWPAEEDSAYHVSDMADFGPWEFSQDIFQRAVDMFRTFLFAADSQSIAKGARVPWDSYDRFIVIHAGGDLQNDVRLDSPRDIPSFTIGVVDTDVVVFPDSTTRPIDRAAFIPETNNQDGYFGAINGVLAHECGHLFFGMYDLYDISTGRPIVGFWSLMDSGNLTGARIALPDGSEIFATGLVPPSTDPFQRQFVGDGLVPVEVDYPDTVTLRDSQRFPEMRRVRLSSDEYLMIENRYISPTPFIELEQDSVTRVILGPKTPDRYEYDALLPVRTLPDETPLPSGGALVWHIDESVIPLEYTFPLDTSLRVNPDFGVNTDFFRPGVSVIEADGLADLGDPGSKYFFGAPFDPFFKSNYATLSDTTVPDLRPHIGTRPHVRLEFLDDPGTAMRVASFRDWQLPGWPVPGDFPPAGPQLLLVDADGDRDLDVCWAGGGKDSPDSAGLFAYRAAGNGLGGGAPLFARLDRRPREHMAALATGTFEGPGLPQRGPALFAVSTYADGPDTNTAGGRVWLLDHQGVVQPGWPAALPAIVTTPPVIGGLYPNATVYVGCADGKVYALGLDGTVLAASDIALPGGVRGRLATTGGAADGGLIAAGGADGAIGVFDATALAAASGWPVPTGITELEPDFLWLHLDGAGGNATGETCGAGQPQLIVHHGARLWAFCAAGAALPGWGRDFGAPLTAALGAGDPDGDGFPEVLTQSAASWVGFVNRTGDFSPGWPVSGTREPFATGSPALAVDVDGDGLGELVALNASGIVQAFRRDRKNPAGWPLASGAGATGAPAAGDLDRDGLLEIVVPDHLGVLYAYTLPASAAALPPDVRARASAWPMAGGDPGRTGYLPIERTSVAMAASTGPLVRGSLKAYPNPARFSAVKFAYQLTEPADVTLRVFDASGHMVTSMRQSGRIADNQVVWEPGNLPAGLYVVQVRVEGASGGHDETVRVGLLR
jgi:M6 family metalloprotease-like protein